MAFTFYIIFLDHAMKTERIKLSFLTVLTV